MGSISMRRAIAFGLLAGAGAAVHAQGAADSRWWLHLGVSHVSFHPGADVSVGGGPFGNVPDVRVSNNNALVADLGYEFAPGWIASLLFGTPPRTTLSSATFGGALGRVRYGSAVFSAHYHFGQGPWRPYVGAGAGYAIVFSSEDAALKDLDVDNAWAPAAIIGLEYAITRSLGVYVDLRKLWLKTHATAAGGVKADLRLDPVIFSAGVSLRF